MSVDELLAENYRLKASLSRAKSHIAVITAERDAERTRHEEMATAIQRYLDGSK